MRTAARSRSCSPGNSCPVSQQYEARIRKLHEDYRDKGVSVVAINPNAPAAMQLADLGYSDVGETLDDMKAPRRRSAAPAIPISRTARIRRSRRSSASSRRHTSSSSIRRARCATKGRIDDGRQGGSADARNAIDALLAGKAVATGADAGRGLPGQGAANSRRLRPQPDGNAAVAVEMAGADELKRLRQNGTGKLLLINFWATWCAPCASEFPDLEATWQM